MEKFKKLLKKESIRYLFIGGCTTAVNFICFAIFVKLQLDINISNFLGIALSIIFAFFTNKFYVFGSNWKGFKNLGTEFLKFVAARIITMLLELFGVWLMVDTLNYNAFLSKASIQIIVIIANYFLSKFLIFKKGDKEDES